MAYQVQLKKLIKIVNPFEHNIFKGLNVTMEDIESRLNILDIFPNPTDNAQEKIIKEIAFKVANYEQGFVHVRLPEMGEVVEEVLLAGIIDLCAAIYRQEEFLNIDLISTSKMAKTLLGIDMHQDQIDFEPRFSISKTFKWNIPNDLESTWHNPEYILKKIHSFGRFHEGLKMYQHLIPQEIIEKSSFSDIFCDIKYISSLPSEWLYKPNFFNKIKSDDKLFNYTWDLLYVNDYVAFIDNKITQKNNSEQYITMNSIQNSILNNKEKCTKLMKQHIQDLNPNIRYSSSIFKYIDTNIVFDSYFMNLNYFYNRKNDGYNPYYRFELKDIPISILSNKDWQKDFISNFQDFDYLNQEDIMPFVHIFSKNKEKFLDALNLNPTLFCIYKFLSPSLKNDSEIIEVCMNKNSKIYIDLPENLENKQVYLKQFLTQYKELYKQVPFEDIVKLNDKDVFKLIVSSDYQVLNNKKFPKEFKQDPYVLMEAGQELKYLGDKSIEKTLFKNFEVAKKLCSFNNMFYWKAPVELKKNSEFALEQLKNNGDVEICLFASKDFCINALKINEKLGDKVPNYYWDDVKFIKTLVEFIDAGIINKQVFNYAPTKVKHFWDSCNIETDYTNFFNKALLKENLENNLEFSNNVRNNSSIRKI